MPYFNMGSTLGYAEMAYLMPPRQLEMADRTEIEFFDDGHTINGEGTFRFLRKHLGRA